MVPQVIFQGAELGSLYQHPLNSSFTEITIISHAGLQKSGVFVNLGGPIPNKTCYLLDEKMRRVPIGMPGELYIGGLGVARGYIKQPDLTTQRFVPDIISGVGRLYRTGDIGRWTLDGAIEYVGRTDDIVKIKGYRIELEEVAGAMARHPDVSAAVAMSVDNTLVAFVTPSSVDISDVRHTVSQILPYYMVPSVIKCLDEFPSNANGKVRALYFRVSFCHQICLFTYHFAGR